MKKIILIALGWCGLCLTADHLPAFTLSTATDGSFLSWPPGRTTIFYRIGSSGSPVAPETVEEMGRAFAEWEGRSYGEISFVYEGLLEGSEAVRDGHNTLVWSSDIWPYGEEVAAISTIWPAKAGGAIAEVDIEFNARDYDWNLPDSPDLLETALHEIGHLLGIGHSFNPGAVMHDTRYPGLPSRKTLSQDDFEALTFLHPRRAREIFAYDIPVLFYPGYFPGEDPVLPSGAQLNPGPGRWITALGSIDLSGEGYCSEILTATRDEKGRKFLQGWGPAGSGESALRELYFTRELPRRGEVAAVVGVDYLRRGASGEAAVLFRDRGREVLLLYPAGADATGPWAARNLEAPPADNLVGMAALDAFDSGFRDSILLLRAYPGRYSLFLHRIPEEGETAAAPDSGIEIPLPGLQEGARILALSVLDAGADGTEDDLVLLELDQGGSYWLHLFALSPVRAGAADISYRNSLPLPSPPGAVYPGRVTGLDLNRDGYFNQLILLGPRK